MRGGVPGRWRGGFLARPTGAAAVAESELSEIGVLAQDQVVDAGNVVGVEFGFGEMGKNGFPGGVAAAGSEVEVIHHQPRTGTQQLAG